MKYESTFDEASIRMMDNDAKIGVLATEDEQGYPHLTFISSIQAFGNDALTWGKFSAGLSKMFIEERPKTGFLVLDAEKRFLSGVAAFTHAEDMGPEFDLYNAKPLFRYNSYMGFSRVYYMDLLGTTRLFSLDMVGVVVGAILTRVKALFCKKSKNGALPNIAKALFDPLDSLKFLCWYDKNEDPLIVPIVQAASAGTDRIVFTRFPYVETLKKMPRGAKAAILCVNLKMESVLVKGVCKNGILEIERVYNSMPPKMEYVWPRPKKCPTVSVF